MSVSARPVSRDTHSRRRRAINRLVIAITYLFAALTTVPLLAILFYLLVRGASSLSIGFLIHAPRPAGESGGGMGNALAGSMILLAIAALVGLPIGVGAGLRLAERPRTILSNTVRFLADVLNGLPSIVMGIFAWQLLVRPMHRFSALAGGIALGVMMIPMVARTTEEMLRLVPNSLREAALALGYTRWRTSVMVVLRTATGGIVTGAEIQSGVVDLARLQGWRVAHFRPARTSKGWRTPVAADGKGWPDLVLVRERVVYAEIKGDGDRLREEQAAWLQALAQAGAEVHLWRAEEWMDGTVDAVLARPL